MSDEEIILNSIYELTHGVNNEPTFFSIDEITDNYGLSEKEVIDIAKENNYNVYRLPGGDDLVNFTIIAHEDLSYGDVVKGTEVDIKDLGDDTDDSFNAEESYMSKVDTNELYRKLKSGTNNFTGSDTLSFNTFDEQNEARKILLKHYNSVETFANTYGNHQVFFIDVDEPKRGQKVEESNKNAKNQNLDFKVESLDDTVIDLDKHSIDITKDAERIASAVQQKECEDFEDYEGRVWSEIHNAYSDLLNNESIDEISHDLAKKFYKESLKEDDIFHGSDIVGGKLEEPTRSWKNLPKHKKYKDYILVHDSPYWDIYDKNGNKINDRTLTSFQQVRQYINNLKKEESLEEDIEKHNTLNPKLFDNNELKQEVRDTILKVVDEFVKELSEDGISLVLKDIILLGSNCSYNYTKDSDLDVHLVVDSSALDCPKELQDKLYGAYRSIFNKNYDIKIKGIPVELYVELDESNAMSNGIYSLNSGWIKEPVQQDIPDLDKDAFDKLFSEWEDRYIDLIGGEDYED